MSAEIDPGRTEPRRRARVARAFAALAFAGAGVAAGIYGTGDVLDRIRPETADASGQGGYGGRPTLVGVAEPARATLRDTVEAVGTVAGLRAVEVVPMASGRVVEIAFEAGADVEEGDRLVQLDDRAEQAELKRAQATLAEARQAYERASALQKQKYASEASYEQARAAVLRAEAAVEQAENEAEDRVIRAPFAGTTGLVEVELGQRVETGTTITTIDSLDSVEVTFWVPELFFPRVERGQAVLAHSRAFGDRTFTGRIEAIDTRISPRSRAFRVRAVIPNTDRALRTGMFLSVALVLEERDAITVPEEAVISEGDANFVFALSEEAAARKQRVRTGLWQDGRVEVIEGLAEDLPVITSGVQGLTDGAPVRLKEADGTGADPAGRRG